MRWIKNIVLTTVKDLSIAHLTSIIHNVFYDKQLIIESLKSH